ncbi:N-acetylmuramoyl-L-alanine amidase [Struthio camelus]|uniref:N-acetylmuramoyl-L-alanine amidase n=1 Tax=Struthio camelus TaxID=8801 RepID=UPI0036040499
MLPTRMQCLALLLSLCTQPATGRLPRHVDSLVKIVEALEAANATEGFAGGVPELARALGGGGTPLRCAVLGATPAAPPALPALDPEQQALLTELLQPGVEATERGVLLAPDGSTVAVAPLLAGIEVALKRATGTPVPTAAPAPMDPLYAVTVAEALGTSYLLARANSSWATLGPDGCWDDVEDPEVFTLMGPPSPVPDAFANGALDGVLLGARLAEAPMPLTALLQEHYYGVTGGRAPSSFRRRDFSARTGPRKLEEEVAAALSLLRVLPATRSLFEDMGDEEVAAVARQAARDFADAYVECPAVLPRCMWGARPYRGTPSTLTPPLPFVYIHHTYEPGAPCRTFATCTRAMRAMQRFHQDTRGWDDIGYSFVVGSDGYLYEGRGWHWVGAHTRGYNRQGYGVGYVGDYTASPPDADALALVRDAFLPCAVRAGRLRRNYTVRGHRQMGRTDCPGDSLFREIETWRGFQ